MIDLPGGCVVEARSFLFSVSYAFGLFKLRRARQIAYRQGSNTAAQSIGRRARIRRDANEGY